MIFLMLGIAQSVSVIELITLRKCLERREKENIPVDRIFSNTIQPLTEIIIARKIEYTSDFITSVNSTYIRE